MADTDTKLIFFDIDGTLITEAPDQNVPESTTEALRLLRKNGHICIINTGRPYAALDSLIKSIEVDGYICGCGIYVRLGEQILMSHHLEQDFCYKIIQELENCKLEWMLEGEKSLYYSDKVYKSFIGKESKFLESRLPAGTVQCLTVEKYDKVRFDKFILTISETSDFERFYLLFQDKLTFIDRGNNFYEVIPKGFSKATGMQYLEKHFGISHKNTIAVGDSSNDIPMLEYAELGILMGGADKKLHKYADIITTSIKDDGIFNAFKKIQLI